MTTTKTLYVQNPGVTLFFAVEERVVVEDHPGFPAHATTYLYVGDVRVACVSRSMRGTLEVYGLVSYYKLPAGSPEQAVALALHRTCIAKDAPRQTGAWVQ